MSDYSDWMSELPEKLWDVPLTELSIPGSHDTMTYCLDLQSPLALSQPLYLRLLDWVLPCVTRPCIYKWGTTQVTDISVQLDAGVRYFDFRIAHKVHDATSDLYFTHAIYTLITVRDTLKNIARWLESHRKEVVILACSVFEGLDSDDHEALIAFINDLFGSKICPKMTPPSLKKLWDLGHQVIISYDNTSASGHSELWQEIPYWWANQVDPKILIEYLEARQKAGRPEGFFVAGLNLTEDFRYILTHPCQSIRTLTLRNYDILLDWVRKQKPGPSNTCLNIICGDFVGTTDLCCTVIGLNKKLLLG